MNNIYKLESDVRKLLSGKKYLNDPRLSHIKDVLTELDKLRGYDKRKGIRSFLRSRNMQSSKRNIDEYIENINTINDSIQNGAIIETKARARNEYIEQYDYSMNVNKIIQFTNISLREYLGVIFLKKMEDTLERNKNKTVYLDVWSDGMAMGSGAIRASNINLNYICDRFATEELYAQLDLTGLQVALKIRKLVGNGKVENIKELFNMDNGIYELDVEDYCGQACLYVASILKNKNQIKNTSNEKLLSSAKALAKKFCDKPSMDIQDFGLYSEPVKVISFTDEFKLCGIFNENKDKKFIHILLYNNHYYLVTYINKLLEYNDSIMCKKCDDIHKKNTICKSLICECKKEYKTLTGYNNHRSRILDITCDSCGIKLMYEGCCTNHICGNKTKKIYKNCKTCNRGFATKDRYNQHIKNGCTFEYHCDNCDSYYDSRLDHRCYLIPSHASDNPKPSYAYDIECYRLEDGTQKFALAYIMALDSDETIYIDNEEEMVNFIKNNKESKIMYAHNGSKYDNFILLELLVKNGVKINDNTIFRGRSPLQFTSNKVTFRDSILLFSAPLRNLPKIFGLPDINKTIFPYDAFTHENRTLKINKDINPVLFNEEDREFIDEFISENIGIQLIDVCKTYCLNDVKILKYALLEYKESMKKICKTLCDNVYGNLDIEFKKKDIDKICEKKSHKERIKAVAAKYNLKENEANIVLEKHGFSLTDPLSSLTKASFSYKLFAKYALKHNLISYLPYSVDKFCREGFYGGETCNFIRFIEKSPKDNKKIVFDDISSSYPACQLFNYLPTKFIEHKILVKIDYKLPENKNAPRNMSIIYYEENKLNFNACHHFIHGITNTGMCGFFRCDIITPQIIHPVLPQILENGRLANTCYNIDSGVYTSSELIQAIKKGYRIIKITEYALFERSTCITNRAPIYGDDIKNLFKTDITKYKGYFNYRESKNGDLKTTTLDKIIELEKIYEIEEYRLYDEDNWIFGDLITTLYNTKSSIDKFDNPGLYECVKILLNSVWGKMAEKAHPEKTSIYTGKDVTNYIKLLYRELRQNVIIDNEYCIGDGVVCKYTNIEKDLTSPKSVAIAAFITGWGRIRLHEGINRNTIYCDTDSAARHTNKPPPKSKFGFIVNGIGTWEREDDDILEFYSTAPKAYSLKRSVPKKSEIYKISSKGIPIRPSTKIIVEDEEVSLTKEIAHMMNKKMVVNDLPFYTYSMLQFKRDKHLQIKVDNNYIKNVNYNSNIHTDNKRAYFIEEIDGEKISFSLPLGYYSNC